MLSASQLHNHVGKADAVAEQDFLGEFHIKNISND